MLQPNAESWCACAAIIVRLFLFAHPHAVGSARFHQTSKLWAGCRQTKRVGQKTQSILCPVRVGAENNNGTHGTNSVFSNTFLSEDDSTQLLDSHAFAAAGAARLTRWPVLQVRHGLVLPPTRNKCNFGSGQSLQMESARKQPTRTRR